jgi:hypothetical protein
MAADRRHVFYYGLFSHVIAVRPNDGKESYASGAFKIPGVGFTVATGAHFWSGLDINEDGQEDYDTGGADRLIHETTGIAHELGHCLWLYHGGLQDTDCKPNYVSVMCRRYSLRGLDSVACVPTENCDTAQDACCDARPDRDPLVDYFSSTALPTIHALDCLGGQGAVYDERLGICGNKGIDWNGVNGCEAAGIEDNLLCDPFSPELYSSTTGELWDRCACDPPGIASCPGPDGYRSYNDWEIMVLGEPRRSGEYPDPCPGGNGGGASNESGTLCFDDFEE